MIIGCKLKKTHSIDKWYIIIGDIFNVSSEKCIWFD